MLYILGGPISLEQSANVDEDIRLIFPFQGKHLDVCAAEIVRVNLNHALQGKALTRTACSAGWLSQLQQDAGQISPRCHQHHQPFGVKH